jgi:hypothetical protein
MGARRPDGRFDLRAAGDATSHYLAIVLAKTAEQLGTDGPLQRRMLGLVAERSHQSATERFHLVERGTGHQP